MCHCCPEVVQPSDVKPSCFSASIRGSGQLRDMPAVCYALKEDGHQNQKHGPRQFSQLSSLIDCPSLVIRRV
jgi:hypothetical protein